MCEIEKRSGRDQLTSRSNGKGIVYLVGAGPGDPGLITVRGLEVLTTADVIVYDSLIPKELLLLARNDSEAIDVGKRGGKHLSEQNEINSILASKAKEGKTVVRLKGGDPFLFGRGGEEVEYLLNEGIEVHVVPGVTSAIAVPALAGIPVTHRDFSSTVTLITGHESDDKEGEVINWKSLAAVGGTLIVLMGMSGLERNAKRLVENGLDPITPAAVIERGATSGQRVVTGIVSNIAEKCRKEKMKAPAIMVIGKVVLLGERLGDLR